MKRRLLSCVLAAGLTLSLTPAALAVPPEAEMAQVLGALDIMGGYPDGELRLDQRVTRAEFSKMAVAASPMGENVGTSTTVSPYPDVPSTHWAASYVEAAVAAGLVNGMLDGTFHPNENITLAQGVTIAVRLLGYRDLDFSGIWPSGQMALYHSLDLDDGITTQASAPMTRRDAMCLLYNLLTAKTKDGRPYLSALGKPMTPTGDIDRVALINDAMDGPVVMAPGWEAKAGFQLSDITTVYRAGKLSRAAALQPNDVLYYSKTLRTVWAYTSKVSGQLQAVAPNAVSPASVTVAGRTYPIETADAAYALSNLGGHSIGDNVTLLLGRSGGVAAVADFGQIRSELYGIVITVGTSSFTDKDGNPYTSKSVTAFGTDGNTYIYPVPEDQNWEEGYLFQISLSGSNSRLNRIYPNSTSGKVSADATMLGDTPLADDMQIIDTNSSTAMKIYPSRLSGVELESDDVKFHHKNADGQIDILILNDATGDLCTYGVITSFEDKSMPMNLMGVYQYDIGGRPYYYISQGLLFSAEQGPVKIEGDPAAPENMSNLDKIKLLSADAVTAVTEDNTHFPVAPAVAVYELDHNVFRASSLERIRSGYALTGYYDQAAQKGGCIRVIVAEALD